MRRKSAPDVRGAALSGSRRRPLTIVLSGPIGCGKSTVATMMSNVGGTVIDADLLARRATERGAVTLPSIRERFGDSVFDAYGSLDRAALAAVVFANAAALADLGAIVHPEVRRLLEDELALALAAEAPFVVVEAINPVEIGLVSRCDEVWLLECSAAIQRERLISRSSASQDDLKRRVRVQGADFVDRLEQLLVARGTTRKIQGPRVRRISTNGFLAETRERVESALAGALSGALESSSA